MADTDKYGIPVGGNPGPGYTVHWYTGNHHQLSWTEMVVSVALGGWPEHLWAEAAATAAAESSRQPFIYNTLKKGHFGLFQISRSAWPDFFKPDGKGLGWISYEINARQGYEIYKKQGWGAWSAHSNGAYAGNLAQAKIAVAQVKKRGTSDADLRSWYTQKSADAVVDVVKKDGDAGYPGSTVDDLKHNAEDAAGAVADATGLSTIADFFSGAWEALTNPSTWMRFGYGALGVVLVAGGLFLVLRPAVEKGAGAVAGMTPEGAMAKAVKG
jgi:hypothetical protein